MMIKQFIVLFLLGLLFSCSSKPDLPVLDFHVHLWDTRRPEGIAWPKPENTGLYRPYLPEHIVPAAKKSNVVGLIAMQSGQTLEDNDWNLKIIENESLFKGVIGNLSTIIGTDKFAPYFLELCKNPKYLGYRLSGKYQKELTPEIIRDLKLTAQKGKSVDFLVEGYTFEDIAEIAKTVPDLRIIMDHLGGVKLDGKPLDPEWSKRFAKMGELPNVYCKVSALFGRFKDQPAPKELRYYREILDLAVKSFGFDRLVYSSDWPVTELTGEYSEVVNLTKSYFELFGKENLYKVFYKNGLIFYRVPDMD